MSRAVGLVLLLGVLLPTPTHAQVTFSNLLETRVGNDPDDPTPNVPDKRLTLFDQFNFDWFHNELRLGLRFETYKPSDRKDLEFHRFSQRYAEWSTPSFETRVGNFEALFGRGVVLRAFELPGVIREEFDTPQFGDSRDLDGVKLQYRSKRLEAVALSGNPRAADDPPTTSRRGLISGGAATVQVIRGVRIGGEYLRLDSQSDSITVVAPRTSEAAGATLQLSLDHWLRGAGASWLSLDTYVEMSRASGLQLPSAGSSPKEDPDEGRGYYMSQNLFLDEVLPRLRWGMSWEYKDYQNFNLGVNEPPTLVREHTYVLLNRNTHEVLLTQEEGYQFESTLNYNNVSTLILNWSRAENRNSAQFREFFAELQGDFRGARLSLFTGDSEDGSKNIFDRQTYGVYGLTPLPADNSLEIEYEQMTATRAAGNLVRPFKDNYVAVTWARAPWVSVSAVHQTTDDPFETEYRRSYSSLSASVNFGNHGLRGFWGQRRGGLQCTAGTCYKVLAFEGVLFQLVTRF